MNINLSRQSIKKTIKDLPRSAGEQGFKFFMVLVLVGVMASSFIAYTFILQDSEPQDGLLQQGFNENQIDTLVEIWEEREERFNDARNISVRDVFEDITVVPLEEEDVEEDELTEE